MQRPHAVVLYSILILVLNGGCAGDVPVTSSDGRGGSEAFSDAGPRAPVPYSSLDAGPLDASNSQPPPAPRAESPTVTIDRIDFGNTASEQAHNFNGGDPSTTNVGNGYAMQSYRQPKLVVYGSKPAASAEQLAFTVAVDPAKQNYLTVKLWGSDGMFGVLRLLGVAGVAEQLDNSNSNGSGNPPFVGRFHYATTSIPIEVTKGKTSVTLTLYSTGYFYDAGGDRAGSPTRPVYSAFVHVNPYFTPSADEAWGSDFVVTGYQAAKTAGAVEMYGRARGMRGDIFDVNNRDGQWHPGGWLTDKTGGIIAPGTPGAPPEVIGLRLGDGITKPERIASLQADPQPADAWRSALGEGGLGNQTQALTVGTTAYLLPPFKNEQGVVEPGLDRYLDESLLQKVVGVLDGLTRMQGSGGGWDSGCLGDDHFRWQGITSSPRSGGRWSGSSARQDPGCVSFEGEAGIHLGGTILRLLNTNPEAAATFKKYLSQSFDADLNGTSTKRAYAYERMLAQSRNWMGFGLKALTSDDYFDKSGTTAYQAMIFIQFAYSGQLALRQLQALYPNPDYLPIDPATMRSIVRQVIGLDVPVFMNHAPPGVEWRTITKAGISETYGTLSSGYDGRYGSGVPVKVGAIVTLSQYDTALSDSDRADFVGVARSTIAAFNNFLYPQYSTEWKPDGSFVNHYAFAQEDVISYRVPYGPNANGGTFNFNLQLDAVAPNGVIQSPLARRAFLLASAIGQTPGLDNLAYYPELEASWISIAGVDPADTPLLPGEPGAPDFVWADVESGALAMSFRGERLFVNANYNRPTGGVNQFVRIHQIGAQIDREATVRMPFDETTLQDDGNLSGDADSAWVVRYGRYLIVLNRSSTPFSVKLPSASGEVWAVRQARRTAPDASVSLEPGSYEVYVTQ